MEVVPCRKMDGEKKKKKKRQQLQHSKALNNAESP